MSTHLSRAEQRRALLRRRLAAADLTTEASGSPSGAPAGGPLDRDRPLTAGQRRMWSIQQLDPTTVGYNVTIALDLTSRPGAELDADRLGQALAWVVDRHDILRTSYRMRQHGPGEGTVHQEVHRHRPAHFERHEVADGDQARVDKLAAALAGQPFDLASDSPLRMALIRTGPTGHTLVVVAHHIVWDDGTSSVFFGELLDRYRALVAEGEPPPARPVRQYLDVADAAERALSDAERNAGLDYWREQLTPLPELLDLPALSGGAGAAGQELSVPMRAGTGARVRELARREGATTFMVLFAAVSALLHRHTGAEDFLIGAPVVNRDLPGGDQVIGYLGNTIALRAQVDPGQDFRALLARAKATCVAAYTHQHVELDEVAQLADPDRRRGGSGLFNVVLSLRSPVLAPFRSAGLTAVRRHVPGNDARFDLTLAVETDGDEMTVEANYPAGARAGDQASLLLSHLDRLLDAALAEPATLVGQLDLLGPGERERLLGAWNNTAYPVPAALTPELLAQAARRTPAAPAVLAGAGTSGRTQMSYAELHASANRLARHLVAAGIGPGDTVALATPRSTHLMVSVLAVLAAGAAYVPVDPDYPPDRVRFMLTDARPKLVLCTAASAEALAVLASDGPRSVSLDDEHTEAALAGLSGSPLSDADRTAPLAAEHPAYLIYTSGSTGRPKGVVISHRALANHLDWAVRRFVGLAGHTLMHSSMSFDFSVTPMLGTLLAGGALELCEDSPDSIANAAGAATFLKITPSHLPLLDAVRFEPDASRTLVIAGEALNGEALGDWRPPATGSTDVINEYGPTETTVGCLLFDIQDGVAGPGPVPVGHPVANTTGHVLDASLRLVPVGVAGELYVGGVQLAQGYLGRPELTASRFVADPYGRPGDRLYRTGDRVRRRQDGALEFLGRVDDQVKIRGFRVEPGEIEAALANHPSVARAAVVARADGSGRTYLAGYVVLTDPSDGPDGPALREHLGRTLPEHMVPAVIQVLAEMPLSPSGKTDRAAVPAPELVAVAPAGREPSGPAEELLSRLFSEVLGGARIGVGDSFFELGGDSILAIQLVSKARKAGLRLTPRAVFEHRTVEALAATVPVAQPAPDTSGPGEPATRETGLVVPSPIQRAFAERGPLGDGHRMSVLLEVPALRWEPLLAAVGAVLHTHAALRARLDRAAGQLVIPERGSVSAESVLTRVSLVPDNGQAVELEHTLAAGRLDPAGGVMVQLVWFDAGPGRSGQLLLVAHHLVVDGVSLRLLAEDLAGGYRDAVEGRTPALPAVGTSMRDWTAGLVAQAPNRSGELPRWLEVVADQHGAESGLGSRRFDPARDTWATLGVHTVELDEATTESVLNTVPAMFFAGADDVLLAALGIALLSWRRESRFGTGPGSDSVRVLVEGHGREESAVPGADLSRTVGWFTNQYPVRIGLAGLNLADALAGGPAAGAAVKRVKEHLRSLPDHGIGYAMLRRLEPTSSAALAEHPDPEIGFNYLGRFATGAGDWPVAPGGISAAYDPAMPLIAPLVVNALCADGPAGVRLTAHWMYAGGVLGVDQVAALAGRWRDALSALAKHAAGPGVGGHTPSDLPLVSLDQSQLDALEAKWRKKS
jgi:amino acid adenylation domain-containing protein/non-ribosomal peptide synthase protein (TIGR01720 family)